MNKHLHDCIKGKCFWLQKLKHFMYLQYIRNEPTCIQLILNYKEIFKCWSMTFLTFWLGLDKM